MQYADVYVGYPIDGLFTYRIPDGLRVVPGIRVTAPLRSRTVTCFVARVHDDEPDGFKAKDIISAVDEEPIFDQRLIDLCVYVADNYISSTGEALAMALPSGRSPSKRFKNPFPESTPKSATLNDEQKSVYESVIDSSGKGGLMHLIFGVTGSGKTEVYIELAKQVIGQGRSVIFLVPEISLSSQVFERLHNVFGGDLIVYHSRLTANQRLYNWMRFYSGDAKIAVGTRSSVFLQAPSLGLIVIDEEHDGSYKENSTPRYNARRVAFRRSGEEKAMLVMGSATPSIESLYMAERGVFRLHSLKGRYGGSEMPSIEVVRVWGRRPENMLSAPLRLYTRKAIDEGRQAIFLLNRRGFAPFLICGDCGAVEECPNCSISLNVHSGGSLLCHYCGYTRKTPDACRACGSEKLERVGSGTQRVEETIREELMAPRVFRLDQDSASRKDTAYELLKKMKEGEVDILLGTQMVAKGFDFHNVTVVGVLLADIGMNLPDFRASERIFALLMQVAGRCGRGSAPGRVIIQTLNEEHALLRFLGRHDYEGFYRHELAARKALGYPPFSRLVRLLVRGKREERVEKQIAEVAAVMRRELSGVPGTAVLGPSKAPLSKIGGNFRHHVIIKAREMDPVRRAVRIARDGFAGGDSYLEIDIDPFDLM
jgi:primosomal protein N' (replication factor Y) (superfamily II helicase)